MPIRFLPLVDNEIYHIYNRGSSRQNIFLNKWDYRRFITTINYYQYKNAPVKLSRFLQLNRILSDQITNELIKKGDKEIDILCYVLMPNHFHFLLRQKQKGGISDFVRKAIDSYTRYFNTKHTRSGAIFQGPFKAVRIETEEQLIHVSRYIHLNPLTSYIIRKKDFLEYKWSSLGDYMKSRSVMVEVKTLLSRFSNSAKYLNFVLDQLDYARDLEKIKHKIFKD